MSAIIQVSGTAQDIIEFARLLEAGAKALAETVPPTVHYALMAGKKVEAIKLYRELTGEGLKESRDFIESLIGKTTVYQERISKTDAMSTGGF